MALFFPFGFQFFQLTAQKSILTQASIHHFHGASCEFRGPFPVFLQFSLPILTPLDVVGFQASVGCAVFHVDPPPGQFHLRQTAEKRRADVQFQLRKIRIPVQLPFTFLPRTLQSGFHRITPSQKMSRSYSEQKTESRKEASPSKLFHGHHFFPALLISSIILDPMEPRRSLQNDPPPFLPEPERDRGLLLYIVSGAGRLKSSVSASQEQKEHSQCSSSRVSSSPSLQLGHFGLNSKRHLLHTRL